jgi:outer membrane protein OmpA-like peptidoglycan-associated protein
MPVVQRAPEASGRAPEATNHFTAAPPIVNEVLSTPGKALDPVARETMGARLHHDFSKVRVHADSRAAASAKAVDAMAYTVGSHVVFDEGKYAPHSYKGQQLLAHELIHTLQQGKHPTGAKNLALGDPAGRSEKETERAVSASAAQQPFAIEPQSSHVQRQMNPKPKPDLAEAASPFLARAIGSVTIDGFDTGKAEISKTNQNALEKTARTIQTLLKKYPGSSIQVTGHTDAVGKEENNQALGQARAESVRDALIATGIPVEAIAIASKGATDLLIKTERAEPRNRRVNVTFEPHTTPTIGAIPDKYSTAPSPTFGGGFRFEPKLQSDFSALSTTTQDKPAPGAAPTPPSATQKPQPKIGEINALAELIKKTSDAVKRDPLVRGLSDLLAELQPLMPIQDAKKAIDNAIDELVKAGSDAALKAILEAITGRAPSPVTEKQREQTGPFVPKKDLGEHIFKIPLPFPSDSPKAPLRLSYEYRDGIRKSYAPGAAIKFTLIAPDKPLEGGKRLVIIAAADRNEVTSNLFGEVTLGSEKAKVIELTAPQEPGKYVFRVNAGLGFDYSSVEEFEVTAPNKK